MIIDLMAATELEIREIDDPASHVHGAAGGEGFGPLQMFVASLGLCAAAVLAAYAQGPLRLPVDDVRLRLRWTYDERPRRVARMALHLAWPGLPEERRAAVTRALESCTIHRTLERPPELAIAIDEPSSGPVMIESLPPSVASRSELPTSEPPAPHGSLRGS